ncbi:MAG: response regulator [Candidatus Zixiibacteriota bacterium]|nr:MAG: response regulator [candidate division Zixibacteria bacterium]
MTDSNKILIVDDEEDTVRWLTLLFNENGYQTVSAIDGSDGFDKAEGELPDLIILDISMPVESGVKMYRNLKDSDKTSKIPVIMLTGVTPEFENFISTRSQVPPPEAYFEKPVNKEELLEKVKELIK